MKNGIDNTCFDLQRTIGKRIKSKRGKKSQKQFCDLLQNSEKAPYKVVNAKTGETEPIELSFERFKKWESGENPVPVEWYPALFDVCKCDAGYLFGDYEESDITVHRIHELTGLSENSIKALVYYNYLDSYHDSNYIIDLVNDFLSCKVFYPSYSTSEYYLPEAFTDLIGTILDYSKKDVLNISSGSKWEIQSMFSDFINDYIRKNRST